MNSRLETLTLKAQANLEKVQAYFDAAGDEDLPADTRNEIKTLNQQADDWLAEAQEIKEAQEARDARAATLKGLVPPGGFPGAASALENGGGGGGGNASSREGQKSIGEQFVSDPNVQAYLKGIAPSGKVAQGIRIHTPAVEYKALITGASATSGGALFRDDRKPLIDMGTFYRPLTVRDIITSGETNSDTVEYVRQGTHTNNAAPVAEATATAGGTGVKPESAMTLAVVTEPVKTIAHWLPATRQALSDAPQLRTLIDGILRYGLEEELEDQIIAGDGTGNNFTGVLNTSGTTAQAYDTSLLITTRRARTKVMTTGRARPTAYVMHPNDWEDIDLLMDAENRFYMGGPRNSQTPMLWGLPVVESEAMTEGYSVVADWRLAILWDRMQATILVSDSHSDFFIRNLIAILAELRAAFGLLRPAAFVEIDLTA